MSALQRSVEAGPFLSILVLSSLCVFSQIGSFLFAAQTRRHINACGGWFRKCSRDPSHEVRPPRISEASCRMTFAKPHVLPCSDSTRRNCAERAVGAVEQLRRRHRQEAGLNIGMMDAKRNIKFAINQTWLGVTSRTVTRASALNVERLQRFSREHKSVGKVTGTRMNGYFKRRHGTLTIKSRSGRCATFQTLSGLNISSSPIWSRSAKNVTSSKANMNRLSARISNDLSPQNQRSQAGCAAEASTKPAANVSTARLHGVVYDRSV